MRDLTDIQIEIDQYTLAIKGMMERLEKLEKEHQEAVAAEERKLFIKEERRAYRKPYYEKGILIDR